MWRVACCLLFPRATSKVNPPHFRTPSTRTTTIAHSTPQLAGRPFGCGAGSPQRAQPEKIRIKIVFFCITLFLWTSISTPEEPASPCRLCRARAIIWRPLSRKGVAGGPPEPRPPHLHTQHEPLADSGSARKCGECIEKVGCGEQNMRQSLGRPVRRLACVGQLPLQPADGSVTLQDRPGGAPVATA